MSTSVQVRSKKAKSIWQRSDSPEEKLSERGAFSLSNAELLGILLQALACKEAPLEKAKALLLKAGNSLSRLSKVSLAKLASWPGMDPSRAGAVVAALELARRLQIENLSEEKIVVLDTYGVRKLMQPYLHGLLHEEFWLLLLDTQKQLLDKRQVSIGGMQATVADHRIIFQHALSEPTCVALILVHNHPSGPPIPSEDDKILTEQLFRIGHALQIQVIDHVIYTNESSYSFADEGMLDFPSESHLSL